MNKNKILLRCLFLIASVVTAQAAHAGEFLDSALKIKILQRIDITCGDTWCEGDYNYKFNSIACDSVKQECKIQFEMIENNGVKAVLAKISATDQFVSRISTAHSVACDMKHLKKAADLIEFIRPDYSELNQKFYAALDACIGTLEKKLNRK